MSTEADPELMKRLRRTAIAGACVLGAIVLVGGYVRFAQSRELDSWTRAEDVPTVGLVAPFLQGARQQLVLPGKLAAFYDAAIYSRVPGYVKYWYYDIGAHVKKGQLLAAIDTPELDQQIVQARADLGSATSAQKLAEVTADRWKSLLPLDAVSKQDAEEKTEDYANKTSLVEAARANVGRLEAMKGFAQILAPFDGIVTKRGADIGDIVTGGESQNATPLFAVSDTSRIRVYVEVPQSYSADIRPGTKATLSLPEYPGRAFSATLVTSSGAISDQSGTMLVELDADNPDGALKPGDYAQVRFDLPLAANDLRLPSSALMFRAAGLQVATVASGDRIVMKPIAIAEDLGTEVEIASGITARDRIVDNPPDSLANGDRVRVASGAR
jgi:multidrug efflux system membrane fusion protein